jgi:hypothetical protein
MEASEHFVQTFPSRRWLLGFLLWLFRMASDSAAFLLSLVVLSLIFPAKNALDRQLPFESMTQDSPPHSKAAFTRACAASSSAFNTPEI